MTAHNTPEERQLIQLIQKIPVAEEEKKNWLVTIQDNGFSEDLAREIQKKIAPGEDGESAHNWVKFSAQFANLVKRWRLSQQTHGGSKHR